MKLPQLKEKLLFTALYAGIVLLMQYFNISCIFVWLFDITCPGCGMVRAWKSVLRLDFSAAFSYHAMFWTAPILYAYFIYGKGFFKNVWADRIILIGIAVGFVVTWLCL